MRQRSHHRRRIAARRKRPLWPLEVVRKSSNRRETPSFHECSVAAESTVCSARFLLAFSCVAHEAEIPADDLRPPLLEAQEGSFVVGETKAIQSVSFQRAISRAESPTYASLAGCAAIFCRVVGGFLGGCVGGKDAEHREGEFPRGAWEQGEKLSCRADGNLSAITNLANSPASPAD